MNEADMPREWWYEQDQDDAWVKEQEEKLQRYEQESDEPYVLPEFSKALLGFGVQFNQKVAIYDYARCLDILERGGLSPSSAIEYMEYDVLGAYVGRRTPVFLTQKNTKGGKQKKRQDAKQMAFDFGDRQ